MRRLFLSAVFAAVSLTSAQAQTPPCGGSFSSFITDLRA